MEIRQLQRAEPYLRGDSDHLRISYGGDYSGLQTDACILLSYRMPGTVLLVTAVRFSFRYVTLERTRREQSRSAVHNAMIIGAGAAGQVILKELKSSGKSEARPCCVIDDNPNKWGRMMEGVPVAGGRTIFWPQ